ncbi:hypothetical protein BDR04DRAFT_1117544 [Suillus decipiens]|nr:hypothetical protein BDR04DRAFT_1117544 [Suillus decipiens]
MTWHRHLEEANTESMRQHGANGVYGFGDSISEMGFNASAEPHAAVLNWWGTLCMPTRLNNSMNISFADLYQSCKCTDPYNNGHLADACIWLNKGPNTSTLTGVLNEYKKLKLRIEVHSF